MDNKDFKQCNGKNCYTKHKAEVVARAVMKKRNRKIRVYECDRCFYYHLTSERKEKARRDKYL